MKEDTIFLSELKIGERGKIKKINFKGAARQRLMAMGLIRGEEVLVRRVAPLGDPIDFVIKGYDLSLRKTEAAKILITESVAQIDEIIKTANEEGLPEDELDYLIGASIIDIAFSLSCYKAGTKSVSMDLVKPDIHEEIVEVWGEDSEFKPYYPLLEQAHAFKLGIKLPDSDNFLDRSIEFIKKVLEYTGLQAPEKK